jgi:hypothetical protein
MHTYPLLLARQQQSRGSSERAGGAVLLVPFLVHQGAIRIAQIEA